MSSVVLLENAGVSLGGAPVLRNVDLEARPGEILGISGPNGSGKTTLVRALATLQPLDQGRGATLGAEIGTKAVYSIRPRIGTISHQPALISKLTLGENVEHALRLLGEDPNRTNRAMDVVGLADAQDRPAEQASYGMKRRTELALFFLRKPDLVLLDEAVSGLDEAAQGLIGALLSQTVDQGGAVVMVSHDADALAARCDRVLALNRGRLEEEH